MPAIQIHQFLCLKDNFGVLIHEPETNVTASIDAPDAPPIRDVLRLKGWRLTHILVTHHHADHTQGIADLKAETGCTVIGPRNESAKIKGLESLVGEGDSFSFGSVRVQVLDTPGHTAGHITYWLPSEAVAFAGDTIFAVGCGRVIEGSMEQMWNSLSKIAKLPPDTELYCGHEYTLANVKFALTIEPENEALQRRAAEVERLVAAGKPTLPTRVSEELATNPFLRAGSPAIRKRLGLEKAADWQVFAEVRERKNRS